MQQNLGSLRRLGLAERREGPTHFGVALQAIPSGDWSCPKCVAKSTKRLQDSDPKSWLKIEHQGGAEHEVSFVPNRGAARTGEVCAFRSICGLGRRQALSVLFISCGLFSANRTTTIRHSAKRKQDRQTQRASIWC